MASEAFIGQTMAFIGQAPQIDAANTESAATAEVTATFTAPKLGITASVGDHERARACARARARTHWRLTTPLIQVDDEPGRPGRPARPCVITNVHKAGEAAGAKAQYSISAVNGVPLEELLVDRGVSHEALKVQLSQMKERPLELTLQPPPSLCRAEIFDTNCCGTKAKCTSPEGVVWHSKTKCTSPEGAVWHSKATHETQPHTKRSPHKTQTNNSLTNATGLTCCVLM